MVPWREDIVSAAGDGLAEKRKADGCKQINVTASAVDGKDATNESGAIEDGLSPVTSTADKKKRLSSKLQSCVVLGAAFFNISIGLGMPYSFGVLYNEFMLAFDAGRDEVTLVISICTGILSAAGMLTGIMINKFSIRTTTIVGSLLGATMTFVSSFATGIPYLLGTLGIIAGLGFCLIYVSALVAVGKHFDKRGKTALAIATVGAPFGIMIFPHIIAVLLDVYGWRGTLTILSAIVFNCCIFSLLMTPKQKQKNRNCTDINSEQSSTRCFDCSIFRYRRFIAYLLVLCIISGSITTALIILPDFSMSRGYDLKTSALFLSIASIGDIISRLLFSQLMRIPEVTSTAIFVCASILFGVTQIIIPLIFDYIPLVISVLALGLTSGAVLSVYSVVVLDMLGQERYPTAMGFAETICGVGNIGLGAIVGEIGEVSGSFDICYYIMGIMCVSGSGLMAFVSILHICISKLKVCFKQSSSDTAQSKEADNKAYEPDHVSEQAYVTHI